MTNNIPISAGVGTQVATDDVSGVHVQLVKLVDGTEDSAVRIPGDATNGLDVDVTRLPALPTGTNNIGDVDVLSLIPGTGATSLGKAEDAVHASGDTGVMALAVRTDTPVPAAAAGDYIPISTDAIGRLWAAIGMTTVAGIDGTASAVGMIPGSDNVPRLLQVAPTRFNGATWDRERGNEERILFASSARTGTTGGTDQINYNHRGAIFFLNTTAVSGTGSITFRLDGKDPISGQYFAFHSAPAITTTGHRAYMIYPGIVAGLTDRLSAVLPRIFRPVVVHADGSSYTYSMSCVLIV